MYSQHFGLTQDPFSIAPDPRYLFMSERHREALAHLLFGVAGPGGTAGGPGGGFVLLTGDIGTGKTTICRCFLEQIPAGCHVAYIFNPKLTVTELLQSICEEFHIAVAPGNATPATIKNYIDALNAFLLESHAAGHSSVLIIDEAQNLDPDVLEQLRLLTNLETNARKLLQIVLIGQPELRTMLERPELEQLAQRVIARFHLDALSAAESTQYIAHRLAVAGHTGALPFDRRALQRIHRLARGVPRRVNLLCGRALLGAWAHGMQRVDRSVVDKAAAEVFGPAATRASGSLRLSPSYALGGAVLLAGAAFASLVAWNTRHMPATAPQAAASAPQAADVSPPQAAAQAQRPIDSVESLLPRLPRDIDTAWRELAPSWNLTGIAGDPCRSAAAQQLQCLRVGKLSVPMLREMGRPGILTLQEGKDPPVYATLIGLGEQTATLQVEGSRHTVRLVALGRLWRGDFATYWRPPPGYDAELRDGSAGPAIERLAARLAILDGAPVAASPSAAQTLDAALRARVRAFQRAHGLQPDGQPGPMTFTLLDSATGFDAPRLQTNLP